MFTRAALEHHKLDPKSLRERFDVQKLGEKEDRLVKRWQGRIQQGIDWNLKNYRHYLAIDQTWESSFKQSDSALVRMLQDIRSMGNDEDKLVSYAERWGLGSIVSPVLDEKGAKTGRKTITWPLLNQVILSIARAYTIQRTSNLTNERILNGPIMPFNPGMPTMQNKAFADVLTQRVDTMGREFGYAEHINQFILKAGVYGHQLVFPLEEWYSRTDWTEDGSRTGREGVRLFGPHPSRSFCDIDYPMWTLNTGVGASYAGYWRTRTWGDVKRENYWNRERIRWEEKLTGGADNWELFARTTNLVGCAMTKMPWGMSSVSSNDREQWLESGYYGSSTPDDVGIFTTNLFERINPKYDLDDNMPDTNLWLRIVMAGQTTPVYVGPMIDRAVTAFCWEPIDNLNLQISLMLEFMSYQDHCSNLLTQGMISIQENLRKVVIFNKTAISEMDVVRKLQNANSAEFMKTIYVGYDGNELEVLGQEAIKSIFHNVSFEKSDVMMHLQMIQQLLQLMERVGGISAQDVGGYGSHEQKEVELHMIREGTGQRKLTQGFWMDRGIEGLQGVVYAQLTNYGEIEAYASLDASYDKAYLEKIGFDIVEEGDDKIHVKVKVGKLRLEQFSCRRESKSNAMGRENGQLMIQLLLGVLNSQKLEIPAQQLVFLTNMAFECLGLPKEFRVPPAPTTDPDIRKYLLDTLHQYETSFRTMVSEEQKKMLTQLTAGLVQGGQQMQPQFQQPQPDQQLLPAPAVA